MVGAGGMAYRRKHQMARASTLPDVEPPPSPSPEGSSLAAQAIRASSAHRDSSLSSAYGESAYREPDHLRRPGSSSSRPDSSPTYEYTSMKSLDESKYGLWGVLARKAKSILEDENAAKEFEASKRSPRPQMIDPPTGDPLRRSYQSPEGNRKLESPKLQRGLGAITSSLNQIGEKIGNALEEGLTIVENRTGDIISETKKLNIRRRGATSSATSVIHQPTVIDFVGQRQLVSQTVQADQETQLKASRDVAMAMAAKAKVLLRELKTVKADLAFAKQRCAQLEEENKILRESRDKGDNPEDDDLIRLQLETLLAEKARLAHENSIYARENRFLREIVEYHQLTMQDVVYVDEGHEEVTEVYPIGIPSIDVDVRPVVPTPPPGVEMLSPSSCFTGPTSPGPSNLVNTLPSSSPSPTARDMISPTGNIQPASGLKATKGDIKQQDSSTSI